MQLSIIRKYHIRILLKRKLIFYYTLKLLFFTGKRARHYMEFFKPKGYNIICDHKLGPNLKDNDLYLINKLVKKLRNITIQTFIMGYFLIKSKFNIYFR